LIKNTRNFAGLVPPSWLRHFDRLLGGTLSDAGHWSSAAIAWEIHMRDLLLLAAVELVLVVAAMVIVTV
jgi:hypothetical protein